MTHSRQHPTARTALRFVAAMALLAVSAGTAPAPVFAQPPAPGNLAGHPLLLSSFEGEDDQPAVAYNGSANQFLVVWSHLGTIYGRGYDTEGTDLSDAFAISSGATSAYQPAAAFSLSAGSYLVVWEDRRGADYDIYGQLVGADYTLAGANLIVYTGMGNQTQPDLAFDGSRYLVVWQAQRIGDSIDICGRFVAGDGAVTPAVLSLAESGGAQRLWPAVAYNAHENEYLVVFQYDEGAGSEVHARRVHPSGLVPGDEYTVADRPYAGEPDAAGAAGGTYVVVWTDSRDAVTGADVYGREVLTGADGALVGDEFALCTTVDTQAHPAIAALPATGEFLVVWDDDPLRVASGADVYGQRLLADVSLAGANFAIGTAPGDQWQPALAGGGAPGAYLVAWEDVEYDMSDIHGQLVAGSGSLLAAELSISARPGTQHGVVVAHNPETGEYLAVWRDELGQIIGRRVAYDGQPLEEPQIIEADGHNSTSPAVAASCGFWVVAWRDWIEDQVEYSILYPQGGVVTRVSIPGALDSDDPTLAPDPSNCRFLQAWEQAGDIYAGLHPNGPIDVGPFRLAIGEHDQVHPAAAFDPDHARFLVVWDDIWAGTTQIRGRTMNHAGGLGPEWTIAGQDDAVPRLDPALAYNPDDHEFLVVYVWFGNDMQIRARRVGWNGALGPEFVVAAQTDWTQSAPAVLYSQQARRYYVAWSDGRGNSTGSGSDVYGRWLEPNGAPAGPDLPGAAYPHSQEYPAVAYDGGHEQGALVWTDYSTAADDVYLRLGALDTTPPTAEFTRDPTVGKPGTAFVMDARASQDDLTPPGALAVRWDWTSDGTWDTPWSLDKVVTQTLTAPGFYTVTLQVADLMRYTDSVSQPIRVLATANTPPQAALAVAPSVGDAGSDWGLSALASTDAETPAANLQVRWDWENDGAWDTQWSTVKVRSHSYTAAGLQLARVEVRDGGGLTDAVVRALLVLPGWPAALQIEPDEVTLAPGSTFQFRATAIDGYGNVMHNPDVSWRMDDLRAGTIDADGLLTGGSEAGTYPDAVRGTWSTDSVDDTAVVTIVSPSRSGVYLPLVVRATP